MAAERASRRRGKLTADEIDAIHKGLKDAGLADYRISSLHLIPKRRSVGAVAVEDEGPCHSEVLPNGHVVLVCGS
jgi:hypothetical protein